MHENTSQTRVCAYANALQERLITWQMICYSYFELGLIFCVMGYMAYLVEYAANDTSLRLLWQNGFRWTEPSVIIAGKVRLGCFCAQVQVITLFSRRSSTVASHSMRHKLPTTAPS